MTNGENDLKVQHSALTVVRTGRFAPTPPPATLNAREAAQALRDSGIAEFNGLAPSTFDKAPYVQLTPQVPFVDGRGWLSFLDGWEAVRPGEQTQPLTGSAVWYQPLAIVAGQTSRPPEVGFLEIQIIGLSPDATCIVTVLGYTPHAGVFPGATPVGAGFQVTAGRTSSFVVAVPGRQTLLIPVVTEHGSAIIQVQPARGTPEWAFIRATVHVVD